MVGGRALILNQMKETSDELTALKARSHGAARGKRKKLRRRSAELEGRLILLISDLLDAQRSERHGA